MTGKKIGDPCASKLFVSLPQEIASTSILVVIDFVTTPNELFFFFKYGDVSDAPRRQLRTALFACVKVHCTVYTDKLKEYPLFRVVFICVCVCVCL